MSAHRFTLLFVRNLSITFIAVRVLLVLIFLGGSVVVVVGQISGQFTVV
jgi:hypothetical protein